MFRAMEEAMEQQPRCPQEALRLILITGATGKPLPLLPDFSREIIP